MVTVPGLAPFRMRTDFKIADCALISMLSVIWPISSPTLTRTVEFDATSKSWRFAPLKPTAVTVTVYAPVEVY